MHLCLLPPSDSSDADGRARRFAAAAAAGCDHVAVEGPFARDVAGRLRDPGADGHAEALRALVEAAAGHGLRVLIDLRIDEVAGDAALATGHPHWFRPRGTALPDPRSGRREAEVAQARFDDGGDALALATWWGDTLAAWLATGIAGLRVLHPARTPAAAWAELLRRARAAAPEAVFCAWTPGLTREELAGLAGAGFDAVFSSLAWWDLRAGWFYDEDAALRAVAPRVVALVDVPGEGTPDDPRARLARRRLQALAAALGGDWAVGADAVAPLADEDAARLAPPAPPALVRPLLPEGGTVAALRLESPGAPHTVVLVNADDDHVVPVPASALLHALGDSSCLVDHDGESVDVEHATMLEPGEVRAYRLGRGKPVLAAPRGRVPAERVAAESPRVSIEAVSPAVDDGRFPVKRTVGERVCVEADAFCDGHDRIAVAVLWRAADARTWNSAPMRHIGNDRWRGEFPLERMGRYEFKVEAWRDVFATVHADLDKKRAAGTLLPVDVQEATALVEAAQARCRGALATTLKGILARVRKAADDLARVEVLLEPATAQAMARADDKPFRTEYPAVFPVEAERRAALYSSWYELFPRSQSGDPARHGTFDDVIAQLPRIRAMHFDVLYMPPIHPIGLKNRKGRNNAVTAQPGEPGSPYAIGSEEGGHTDIHPELGGIEAFRRLRDAAAAQGLELALDFAIQCAPDHPWLREHADWFTWRADGSIPYAENPPKKYQDIVNVDFYASGAVPALWNELRDVVLFWVNEGVRLFRVDNPHTKPFPFWEWMIAEVRGRHPDVVFLSEAFTRPKMMYRLAKVGFSQSYTYFTWRNHKAEIAAYLEELNQGVPRECFRPHFFVNTPDINPHYLQTSGRPGHLVRAALATTLSGLWGMYQGFELCEATPLAPGKEEYLDSEKYEIRAWPARRPGDIVDEIARLNLLRRLNPELQTHLGTRFYVAHNDQVLYYGRFIDAAHLSRARSMVLVAVNLDPHHAHSAAIEVPLWEFGLPDHAGVEVDDLWTGRRFRWDGKVQHVHLDPSRPFSIWRIRAGAER
ncbi:alpha-1,4-glucan--maltose-1-phosphate maltosyltransferase [Coralloluteibacterium thermophilus]|uniref:Alpha-1,4-glucan:maltose-1-phosphate maltosyltransferase n=1 Tax=Coralloluteibacterium thermophilum TaxID=2707049 RepID=A0ABV9NG16_9GAMM